MGARDVEARLGILRRMGESEIRSINRGLLGQTPLFDIEVAAACNVVCTFCPRDAMARKHQLMDDETFQATLEFLPRHAVAMLSGLGDAALHPKLPELVRRLVARGTSTCVITNGVRLTPALQDALLGAGIAEIQVSVHGMVDATVHGIMPRGADPGVVRGHVERLARVGGPRLRINFVETCHNGGERAAVETWARSLGARFFYRRQHTRGGLVGDARPDPPCDACGIFASVTFVTADGDVLPCVNDVRGEGRLGNVRDLTWVDVLAWKREVIGGGRWFAPCAECDDDYRWILLANGGLADA